MSDRLSSLLSPHGMEFFAARFRAREHIFIDRRADGADGDRFYADVLRVEDLDLYLQSGSLPAAFINVVTDGATHPPEQWSQQSGRYVHGPVLVALPEQLLALYRRGSTLILNGVHKAVPPVSRLCRDLMKELGFGVQANVYITPPGAQGFAVHRDTHDALILQISGRKSWRLYPRVDKTEPLEFEMRSGDLLYIPRGIEHDARCSTDHSVHLTLGLYPVYAFQLLERLAALAVDDRLFQDPAPALFEAPGARQAFNDEFAARVGALMSRNNAGALMEGAASDLVESQLTAWPGRFSDTLRVAEITAASVLRARPEIIRGTQDLDSIIEVRFAGSRLSVPAFLRTSLDRMLDGTPFTVQELPGMMTADGKVNFVRPFLTDGLLTIVSI
jgi:hypothetical protein